MRLIPPRAWSLVILSAILQILIFPIAGPVPAWRTALSWIALVPLLLAILSPDRTDKSLSLRNATSLGYFCGVLWYAGNCSWIYQTMYLYGGLPKPIAFAILILFALYLGLYHALFACIVASAHRLTRSVPAALCLAPFAWVAVELARARVTGFPWDLLGNSQIDNLFLTRLAPIAGVMSITFVLVAFNSALTSLFFLRGARHRTYLSAAVFLFPLVVLLVTYAGRQSHKKAEPASAQAVMMQENLAVGATGKEVAPISSAQELSTFSKMSSNPEPVIAQIPPLPQTHPTIIIWPEAPSHLRSDDSTFRAAMAQLATSTHASLIIGSLGVDFDPASTRGYYLYDSASLFDAAGTYKGRYDKIHLVPWGEYIPFKQFFGFAHKLTEGAGDMDAGQTRTVFTTGGHTYGIFVCYESIFGDEVRRFVQNGAEVLVNISDDGWYGDTGAPWQHLNMARMRAIENHRWVLRSTNTGITTAISPSGRFTAEAPRHTRAAFAFPFDFDQATTFYTRHGDWLAYLCALVTALGLGLAWLKSRPGQL